MNLEFIKGIDVMTATSTESVKCPLCGCNNTVRNDPLWSFCGCRHFKRIGVDPESGFYRWRFMLYRSDSDTDSDSNVNANVNTNVSVNINTDSSTSTSTNTNANSSAKHAFKHGKRSVKV